MVSNIWKHWVYSNPLKVISFKLKERNMKIDRRSGQDRRQVNFNLFANKIERRKQPDRRTSGFHVSDVFLSEEDFSDLFALFLPDSYKIRS